MRRPLPALAAALALLAGCATPPPTERVVLLPSTEGGPSAVIVTARDGKTLELNTPYAVAQVAGTQVQAAQTTAQNVEASYGRMLAATPPRVRSFTLYFETNRAVLVPESQRELDRILADVAQVPAAEIDVIGHTDTRGGREANDALGRTRAEFVGGLLESRGFARSRISVQSRGERELLVPTPDNTDEPRNRRVEIRLR
jgi:OmpA-OmpF porin, OOP family